MVIDTSALIAILLSETPARPLVTILESTPSTHLSAASLVEAGIVMQGRLGEEGERRLDQLLFRLGAEVVPVSREYAEIARSAFRRFGKGRHPAGLNFGDCFAYALARPLGEPLLFLGDHFSQTDVAVAAY
jgi:ribonuclease VapC